MSLRAASSIMGYTGPDGCNHSRPTRKVGAGKNVTVEADPDWVLSCVVCEPTLADHELWGPADAPAPLTGDEQRLVEAQQADANRNVWTALAQMPAQFSALAGQQAEMARQNQVTNTILAQMLQKLMGDSPVPGLPPLPADVTAPPAAKAPAPKAAAKRAPAAAKD